MLTSLVFSILLLSSQAFAQTVLTDADGRAEVSKRFYANPTYLKKGPLTFKVYLQEIGKSATPFYRENNLTKIRFQKKDKCFEVRVETHRNVARKKACSDFSKKLKLESFPGYFVVTPSELVREGLTEKILTDNTESFKWLTYLHTYATFKDDAQYAASRGIPHNPPMREMTITNRFQESILVSEKEFKITQRSSLLAEGIPGLNRAEEPQTNTIKLKRGDLIFSNGKGQLLLLQELLPAFAADTLVFQNEALGEHLSRLEAQSSETQKGVCHRDNFLTPTPKDCHQLVFKTTSQLKRSPFSLLKVDLVANKFKVLQ